MKRIALSALAAVLALVTIIPTAAAREMMNESVIIEKGKVIDESMMEQQPKMMEKGKMEMPKTAGPSDRGYSTSRANTRDPSKPLA